MYVTLDEAEQIVLRLFLSTSSTRGHWEALTDDDKLVCLHSAYRELELLPFTGRPTDDAQSTAFPRWPHTEVPDAVKDAQVLIALDFADPNTSQAREKYQNLRSAGVSSYRIGKFSETFKVGSSELSSINRTAVTLLRPWLDGGFRIV